MMANASALTKEGRRGFEVLLTGLRVESNPVGGLLCSGAVIHPGLYVLFYRQFMADSEVFSTQVRTTKSQPESNNLQVPITTLSVVQCDLT